MSLAAEARLMPPWAENALYGRCVLVQEIQGVRVVVDEVDAVAPGDQAE